MSSSLVARRAITFIQKAQLPPRKFVNNTLILGSVRQFSVSRSRNMKLVQFTYKDKPEEIRAGYLEGDNNVVDVNKVDSSLPTTLLDILKNGDIEKVKKLHATKGALTVPLDSVNLKAPILGMDKVLCVGLNYKDHCEEQNLALPAVPMVFSKFSSTVIGPSDALRLRTDVTQSVSYEVEMTVVIGKTASRVKASEAYDYVLGITIAQDPTAKDWLDKNGGQVLLGKVLVYE